MSAMQRMIAVMAGAGLIFISSVAVAGAGYRTSLGVGASEVSVAVVSGTPYEMGFQYGQLMKAEIQAFVPHFLQYVYEQAGGSIDSYLDDAWAATEPYTDDRYEQEIAGMAAGAEIAELDVRRVHSVAILESYSCSSIAVWGAASDNRNLYQTRNLDWDMAVRAHDYPCIVLYLPEDGVPHVNIAFAGLVGAHTGMNMEGIVLAEMGDSPGSEFPYDLNGTHFMPLFRQIMYDAYNLTDALDILTNAHRIKRYHYVFGDGRHERRAVKIQAHAPEAPPNDLIVWNDNDPLDEFFPNVMEDVVYNDEGRGAFPAIVSGYGAHGMGSLIDIANSIPIVGDNVVNVVYDATSLEFWCAYAEGAQEAYTQPYILVRPLAFDGDGDGVPDLEEGIADPDLDTLPNYLDIDSDGDDIADLDEGTGDPDLDQTPNYLDLDSDDDTLDDAFEHLYGLDPLDATGDNGIAGDPDGDGFNNWVEYHLGTNPMVAEALEGETSEGEAGGSGTVQTVGSGTDAITLVRVSGTRYEMGYWYGKLLAGEIAACWQGLLEVMPIPDELFQFAIASMWNSAYFDTDAYEDELQGMADGCAVAGHPEVTFEQLQRMQMIPDMGEYNCGLFALWGDATANGHLYQLRNLDWEMGLGVQDHPVVAIYEPVDGNVHAVIGFAGMLGAAGGGISQKHMAVSEIMGGFDDEETLNGVPFPFLLRDCLYHDQTLQQGLDRLQNATRTNEYYYCLSGPDGSGNDDARLLFTSHSRFDDFGGGEAVLPHPHYSPFYTPLPDAVYWKRHDGGAYAMPGAEDDRKGNQTLYAAINERYGQIDAEKAIEIARADGVSGTLMSIVYDTTAGEFWVAYADGASSPATTQNYVHFSIGEGEGEGEPVAEGEGEPIAEGEGESIAEGEGESIAEGEGEPVAEGEGESVAEGEGETVTEGEGESVAEGEGESVVEGEGESIAEGEGESIAEGEGESLAEGEPVAEEGESESRIAERAEQVRGALLAQFGRYDSNADGSLSLSEAQALFADLSEQVFAYLDTDSSGGLSRQELGEEENPTGCNSLFAPKSERKRPGDLAMFGLSLAVLLTASRWKRA